MVRPPMWEKVAQSACLQFTIHLARSMHYRLINYSFRWPPILGINAQIFVQILAMDLFERYPSC